MIALEDRQRTAQWVDEARREGARLSPACEVSGVDTRTLQRWKASTGLGRGDGRPHAVRPPYTIHERSHSQSSSLGRVTPETGNRSPP